MPTATTPPLPMPPAHIPVIDQRTGLMTREWYDFLFALDQLLRALRLEIP